MRFRWIIQLFLLLLLFSVRGLCQEEPVTPPSDTTDIVKKVVQLYHSGRIDDAEFHALRALEQPENLSRWDRFTLHQIAAFCAIANGNDASGVYQFKNALQLNAALTPDPITWSPKVRQVFSQAKAEYDREQEVSELHSLSLEADVGRRASLRSLYLPGSGQFMKGQRLRGAVVASLFVGAAAAFLYAQATLPAYRDRYLNATEPHQISQRWNDYRQLYHLSYISGVLAASVYVYAFFDALWSEPAAKPQTPTSQKAVQ